MKAILPSFKPKRQYSNTTLNKAKLKIGIIANMRFPIEQNFQSGMEGFTYVLAKKLIDKGHDVTLFTCKGSDTDIKSKCIGPATGLVLPKTKYSVYFAPMYYEYQAYTKLIIDLCNSNFDVLHNTSVNHLPNIFSDLLPMPLITTLNTLPSQWLAGSFEHSTNKNNTCVTTSKYMHDIWKPIINSLIIINGIDLNKFKYIPNEAKKDYAIWFGKITPEKGTIYAINAAKKAKIRLKICGAMYNRDYLERNIRPELNNNIEYLGYVPEEELIKLIARAKVCINTPYGEQTSGTSIAKALACGTPVASFDKIDVQEILNNKSGCIAKSNDVDSLTRAIVKAQKLDPFECRKRAEEIANLDEMISNYENLYKDVIAKHKNITYSGQ